MFEKFAKSIKEMISPPVVPGRRLEKDGVHFICECGEDHHFELDALLEPILCSCGATLTTDMPIEVVRSVDLEWLKENIKIPLLVDFWAAWCGPCKAALPAMNEAARRSAGRYLVVKLDTVNATQSADEHEILGIPTLVLFEDGEEVAREYGVHSADALETLALTRSLL